MHSENYINLKYKSLNDVIHESEASSIFFDDITHEEIVNPVIYHYTTPDGLLGILDEDAIKLYFTRYDCVNDTSEGKNVLETYQEVCDQLYKSKEIDKSYYDMVINVDVAKYNAFSVNSKVDDNSYILQVFPSEYQAFICCFSKDKDSLPMWNYYSKDGHYQGYALGLSGLMFLENKSNLWNQNGVRCLIGNVIYDKDKKIEIVKYWLKNLYNFSKEDDEDFTMNKSTLKLLLFKWQLFFKSNYFAHENERRAVIFTPNNIPSKVELKPLHIEYRTKGAYIIPYVTVAYYNCKNYLHKVVIGPLSEKAVSQSATASLLKQRGYQAEIVNSNIPIRF